MAAKDKQHVKRKMKRKYVDGNGEEHYLDIIEVDITNASLEDLVELAIEAEEDDKKIEKKAEEIKEFIESSKNMNTLKRWYELGRKLQFVDQLQLKDENSKNEAFRRLFKDLQVDSQRNPSVKKIIRYPRHMYDLSKIPKTYVFLKGMTWSRWFDILEYKRVWKNPKVLKRLVEECCEANWNSKELRKKLQILNRQIKERSN